MRKLAALALLGLTALGPLAANAETPAATRQIVQQRTPDGSILLTDRPRPGATTERAWQIEKEDPVAARQRAIDVKAEANLVAERIDRRIAAQQRAADQEFMRQRMARLDYDRAAGLDQDDGIGSGVLLFAPQRFRMPQRFRAPHGQATRPHAGLRGSRVTITG